jgi:hypothetical protein
MHRCDLCFGPIGRGEVSEYWSGMWDGEWGRSYLHQECAGQLDRDSDGYGYEYTPGEGDWPERVRAYWKPFTGQPCT